VSKGICGLAMVGVLVMAGCAQSANHAATGKRKCSGSSNGEHTEGKWNSCTEDDFISAEEAKIEAHAKMLVALGHMSNDYVNRVETATILGRYAWHGNGSGYFGAYSFYEPAFEQAKKGWFLHGEVLEGSNELWTGDDGIKFDSAAIGLTIQGMNMSWFANGKYTSAWFTAKIVGIKDDDKTAILDKRAPHHAEQWGMQIVPKDWRDMCECTNNFHPPFVDGHPVVE
jgi:hypothetical protein